MSGLKMFAKGQPRQENKVFPTRKKVLTNLPWQTFTLKTLFKMRSDNMKLV